MGLKNVDRSKTAILLLGHGSKLKEANDTLRRVAATLTERSGFGYVQSAFLQMEEPDIRTAVALLVDKGFAEFIVMPYFLYPGAHVTQDIPEELEKARTDHPQIRFTMTESLGFHDRLIDITLERISELENGAVDKTLTSKEAVFQVQHPIEKESFRIITEELGETDFTDLELQVVKRVIHTTADFEFKDILKISPGAIASGVRAIADGKNIITDVRMVEAGIMKYRTAPFGAKVTCFSSDAKAQRLAEAENLTKTAASMRIAAEGMEGAIVAIGNAPTALNELLDLIEAGKARPALVIGVPVGFVGAKEAKDKLFASSGVEFITALGRKGGSTVAVSIVNALAIIAGTLNRAREI